jgi:hypothetical protein
MLPTTGQAEPAEAQGPAHHGLGQPPQQPHHGFVAFLLLSRSGGARAEVRVMQRQDEQALQQRSDDREGDGLRHQREELAGGPVIISIGRKAAAVVAVAEITGSMTSAVPVTMASAVACRPADGGRCSR